MRIFGVDPGSLHSGLAVIDIDGKVLDKKWVLNDNIEAYLLFEMDKGDHFGCEWIQNYGRMVGESTFRSAYAAGRFAYVASVSGATRIWEPTRPEVLKHHCGRSNVDKPALRAQLLERYGGKSAKKKGQDLHGISNHIWDALAVALFIKDKLI